MTGLMDTLVMHATTCSHSSVKRVKRHLASDLVPPQHPPYHPPITALTGHGAQWSTLVQLDHTAPPPPTTPPLFKTVHFVE